MTANTSTFGKSRSGLYTHSGPFKRWRIAVLTVFLGLCASSHGAEITWPPPDDVQQRVEAAVALVDRLQSLVPQPAENTMDWAETLDFDFDTAITHVSKSIAYEPYIGVMRGPEGTAFVGSGNAWDQSLLLASLIRTMGGSAQIVTGVLEDGEARRLLDQVFVPSQSFEAVDIDAEAAEAAFANVDPSLADYFNRVKADLENVGDRTDIVEKSEQLSNELLRLMRESGQSFSVAGDATSLLQSIAEDYAWVRWRLGPTDEWVDVHPAFGDAPAPSPEAIAFISAEVPKERQHLLSLQLFIERGVDDGESEPELVPVMSAWEMPTANLYRRQLYLGMGPMSPDDRTETTVLIPTLNGEPAPGAKVATVFGLTAPPDAAASPAGAIFSTMSTKGGKGVEALGSMSSGEDESSTTPRLLGVVLEARIRSPQGVHTITRRMADLRGVDGDGFARAGTFQMIMDVHVGAGNPAIAYHDALDYYAPFFRIAYPMLAMARGSLPVPDLLNSSSYKSLGTPKWPDFDLFSSNLVQPNTEREATFRNGPLIAARRTNMAPNGELLTVIDVLWNPSTVLRRGDEGQVIVDKEATMVQGVRETLMESSLAGRASHDGWSERNPELMILASEDLEEEVAWPEAALQAARDDLENGFLLALTDGIEPHWWRIDPDTGQTLGMNRHGGAEALGYVITLVGIGISVALFKQSVEACDIEFAGNRDMADCCIVGNLMMTYTTSGVTAVGGGIVSAATTKFSSGIGAIASTLGWTGADIGMGLAIGAAGSVGDQCRASAGQL